MSLFLVVKALTSFRPASPVWCPFSPVWPMLSSQQQGDRNFTYKVIRVFQLEVYPLHVVNWKAHYIWLLASFQANESHVAPQTDTAPPPAQMFILAFMSWSWWVSHWGKSHSLRFRGDFSTTWILLEQLYKKCSSHKYRF